MSKINHYIAFKPLENDIRLAPIRTLQISEHFALHKPILAKRVIEHPSGLTNWCYLRWQNNLVLSHISSGIMLGHIYNKTKSEALEIIQTISATGNWNFTTKREWRELNDLTIRSKQYNLTHSLR